MPLMFLRETAKTGPERGLASGASQEMSLCHTGQPTIALCLLTRLVSGAVFITSCHLIFHIGGCLCGIRLRTRAKRCCGPTFSRGVSGVINAIAGSWHDTYIFHQVGLGGIRTTQGNLYPTTGDNVVLAVGIILGALVSPTSGVA